MTKPSSVEVVVTSPGDEAAVISPPVAQTLPTPPRLDLTALIQDPPPESKWFWRRLYTFMVTILSLAGVGFMIYKLAPGMIGVGIAYGLIALVGWMATLYLVAPSADEVARIFAKLAHLRQIIPSLSTIQSGMGGGYGGNGGGYNTTGGYSGDGMGGYGVGGNAPGLGGSHVDGKVSD